jgi:hypothetical protein
MPATISEKFRIFNAKQFLESLSEPSSGGSDSSLDRTLMYFFIGRPQAWYSFLEIYGVSGTFTVGESVYVGASLVAASFKGTVVGVYPNSLLLSGIGPTQASAPTSGASLIGNSSAATAKTGVYRYATDEVPPAPFDNQREKSLIYDDMIAMKRIKAEQARHVVRRWNWDASLNPKFEMWKPDYSAKKLTALGQERLGTVASKFYVMNSQYEVFVCLYNGEDSANTTGINVTADQPPATVPVSGKGTYSNGIFTQTNGKYIWKYLYTIPTDDVIKFLSTDFMPISTYGGVAPVDGAIQVAFIKDAGANLPSGGPYFAPILGDGTGGKVQITIASGAITGVTVVAAGTGYSYASVALKTGTGTGAGGTAYGLFSDPALSSSAAVGGTGRGEIEVVIPPFGGYGYDMVAELNAKRVMTNIRLTYAEGSGDFPVDNDFRTIGILQDPLATGGSRLTADNASGMYAVRLSGVAGTFFEDEEITQTVTGGTAKGKVVSWTLDGATGQGVLRYIQHPDLHTDKGIVRPFASNASNLITGQSSLLTGQVVTTYALTFNGQSFTAGLSTPEVKFNSGEVIYIENRRLIRRAADQIEDIKLVIEF